MARNTSIACLGHQNGKLDIVSSLKLPLKQWVALHGSSRLGCVLLKGRSKRPDAKFSFRVQHRPKRETTIKYNCRSL